MITHIFHTISFIEQQNENYSNWDSSPSRPSPCDRERDDENIQNKIQHGSDHLNLSEREDGRGQFPNKTKQKMTPHSTFRKMSVSIWGLDPIIDLHHKSNGGKKSIFILRHIAMLRWFLINFVSSLQLFEYIACTWLRASSGSQFTFSGSSKSTMFIR